MSQHIIHCPGCGKQHEVDVCRSGGQPVALIAGAGTTNAPCNYITEDVDTINNLLRGLKSHPTSLGNMWINPQLSGIY